MNNYNILHKLRISNKSQWIDFFFSISIYEVFMQSIIPWEIQ